VRAIDSAPGLRSRLRLVIVGDGPLRPEILDVLAGANARELAWLPGARDDVADVLRALDVFVLPSLAEGISNTILEALACGLPVIATRVGGNAELLGGGETGTLVPAGDDESLAHAIVRYALAPELGRSVGRAARARAESLYGLDAMVSAYCALYDTLLARRATPSSDPVASASGRATTWTH
jgi:glycosyltransferase involved in cell wall biosynthesis